MLFFKNNNALHRRITKALQLSLLIAFATGTTVHDAHATTIYQCKQAGGKIAFQEVPCAASDAQSVVTPTIPTPSPKSPSGNSSAPSASNASPHDVCRMTGIKVFDPSRPQGLQHPQAAFNHCKKTLPSPLNSNGVCLEACLQAWVGEYKKTYVSTGQ